MGIRARLTIGMAVLLLAGFALLGAVVVQTTHAALVDQVDTRIWAAKSRMGPLATRQIVAARGTTLEDAALPGW